MEKMTAEDMSQVVEGLPGAWKMAAKSMGCFTHELTALLEKQAIAKSDFMPHFFGLLSGEFGKGLAVQRVDRDYWLRSDGRLLCKAVTSCDRGDQDMEERGYLPVKGLTVDGQQLYVSLSNAELLLAIASPIPIYLGINLEGTELASVDDYAIGDRHPGSVYEVLKPFECIRLQEGLYILDAGLDAVPVDEAEMWGGLQ